MKKAILFAAALFVAVASFAQNEYNYQKRSLFEQFRSGVTTSFSSGTASPTAARNCS